METLRKEALVALGHATELLTEVPMGLCDELTYNRLCYSTTKIDTFAHTICFIGPAKSGKSTSVNALLGVDIAPSENLPCTVLPTIYRHVAGRRNPRLLLNESFIAIFSEAIDSIRTHTDEIWHKCEDLTPTEFAVLKEITHGVGTVDLQPVEEFEDVELRIGFENVRNRLLYLNTICRIFAKAEYMFLSDEKYDDILVGTDPLTLVAVDCHWPVVEMEMEPLRNKEVVGQFQVMDTPPLDEAHLFPAIDRIISLAIEFSDAAVCVLSCPNPSPDSVNRIHKEISLCSEFGSLIFVLVNHINDISSGEEESVIVEATGKRIFTNNYDNFKNNVFGVDAKKVKYLFLV